MDEATQTVGWTRTDVIVTDKTGVDDDSPNEGRTELRGGVNLLDYAIDATPNII